MGWMNQIGNLLDRYSGTGAAAAPAPETVNQDFSRVAQTVPQQNMGQALGAAFRSDQTPPFGQMVASMFGQSNDQQKAGVLNHLLNGVSGGLPPGLSGLFPGGQQVTPAQASSVSPDQVQQLATHAQSQNPSVLDTVGNFYAQHPTLVQGLGAGALAMMMSHLSQR